MSRLADAYNKAKHLVVEDDDPTPTPKTVVKPTEPVTHAAFDFSTLAQDTATRLDAASGAPSPFAVPGTAVLDENVYQSVLKKTNFDETPVGKAVHKYFDALDGSGLDTNARFRAAMKQAAALDGITAEQVLSTFDQMQTALEKDAQGFQGFATSVETSQITGRQQKIADLQAQVANLSQHIARLQSELVDQQSKHANAVTQYGLAQSRRAQEITAQKAQFAALLK